MLKPSPSDAPHNGQCMNIVAIYIVCYVEICVFDMYSYIYIYVYTLVFLYSFILPYVYTYICCYGSKLCWISTDPKKCQIEDPPPGSGRNANKYTLYT